MGHSTAMQMQYNVPGWKPTVKGKRKMSKKKIVHLNHVLPVVGLGQPLRSMTACN
jgi:hypothetical protein